MPSTTVRAPLRRVVATWWSAGLEAFDDATARTVRRLAPGRTLLVVRETLECGHTMTHDPFARVDDPAAPRRRRCRPCMAASERLAKEVAQVAAGRRNL